MSRTSSWPPRRRLWRRLNPIQWAAVIAVVLGWLAVLGVLIAGPGPHPAPAPPAVHSTPH
ncbi:hypothetical protein ACQP2F_21235 [Actinoplanes sp. CA-030573]|uniref:hypothetical protein n=1 Tax=Actinoplanes sp. CA-030573 TaxID=3239898 RepID=UPI003D8CCD11